MSEYIKKPEEIETRSFEIISELLGEKNGTGLKMDMIKRVIHTTADFEYFDILNFKKNVEEELLAALKEGATIISDTNMIKAGISKKMADRFGVRIECFVNDKDVHVEAKEKQITRSMANIDRAATIPGKKIFAIGNAPTALYRIMELMEAGILKDVVAVIGIPVGFVGAEESKETLWAKDIPSIVTLSRKGGSTIVVALINAVLKEALKDLG